MFYVHPEIPINKLWIFYKVLKGCNRTQPDFKLQCGIIKLSTGLGKEKWSYALLKILLSPQARYRIYLDIKDTRGGRKVEKLHDVLSNNLYDFRREIIERVQIVRSHEVEILQLADLLIGAVSYVNRALQSSTAKLALIERMRERSGYDLTRTTLFREEKVNLFVWGAS